MKRNKPAYTSTAEMQVWIWVPNNPNPLNLDLPDIGTGETVNFSLGATVDNAPAFIQLKITGDDDDDFGGGLCTQGLPRLAPAPTTAWTG